MAEQRLIYIDNIRVFLIILVVLLHISIIYGGVGNYPIKETATDSISPIILTFFNAICQSFFMGLFFLLAGYFVPGSLDRKCPKKFIIDRLIRLGIPLLIYTTLFRVFVDYLIQKFNGEAVTFVGVLVYDFRHLAWMIGPLWFVEALLIFTFVYVLYRALHHKFKPSNLPSNRAIIITMLIMAIITFSVRIFIPVGKEIHVFQFAHFSNYILCFWLGIMAYRGNWLDKISNLKAWRLVALGIIIALPFMMLLGIDNVDAFMGGFTLQSLLFSAWETIACYSIIISVLIIFKNRFNAHNKLSSWMAPNFYSVYIIHQIVVMPLAIVFTRSALPTYIKFFIVSLIAVPLCFIISDLIRRIPYTRRVLG